MSFVCLSLLDISMNIVSFLSNESRIDFCSNVFVVFHWNNKIEKNNKIWCWSCKNVLVIESRPDSCCSQIIGIIEMLSVESIETSKRAFISIGVCTKVNPSLFQFTPSLCYKLSSKCTEPTECFFLLLH